MQSAVSTPTVVAAAAAVAIGLVVLGRNVTLRWRDDESLRERIRELHERIRKLQERIREQEVEQKASISALWASQSVIFTVVQYNILASYLGDNRQPWFLYGLPAGAMPDSRREAIMTKFYERDRHGKLLNVGWPNYVRGVLSDQEQRQVEACNERYFVWDVRSTKLLDTVLTTGADLISLVELDLYESFWQPNMNKRGYDSAYRKRPRAISQDGCGIFWRRSLFTLEGQDHLDFVDRYDPETERTTKDRCALFVLLRHVYSGERVLFISTHLARNPEDHRQTKMRAKQAAALFQKLTPFAALHDALNVPVILAGDLNTTNIRKIGNIARAVLELCDQPVHPFVFSAQATRSTPTSVTSTRRMRIDYLLHSSGLAMDDSPPMPLLTQPIPDAIHPSDHIPLVIKVRLKSTLSRLHEVANAWAQVVLADGDSAKCSAAPLSSEELDRAFTFFDGDSDGSGISEAEMLAGLRELHIEHHGPQLLALLEKVLRHDAEAQLPQPRLEAQVAPVAEPMPTTSPRGGLHEEVMPLPRASFRRAYLLCFAKMQHAFRKDMMEAFAYFDTDASGSLTHDELRTSFRDACPFDVADEDFEQVWQQLDADNDGQITLDEFVDTILHKQYACDNRACPLRSKQDNLALIHQKSRGWQPASNGALDAVRVQALTSPRC